MTKNKAVSARLQTVALTTQHNAERCEIYDSRRGGKSQGGTMKPELEALYEDWQKHAFAVGFTAAVRLLTK